LESLILKPIITAFYLYKKVFRFTILIFTHRNRGNIFPDIIQMDGGASVDGPIVTRLPSNLYDAWNAKTFHNPTLSDDQLPAPWMTSEQATSRCSSVNKLFVYVKSIQEYRSHIVVFGETDHAETVSLVVRDFQPWVYVDAPALPQHLTKPVDLVEQYAQDVHVCNSIDLLDSHLCPERTNRTHEMIYAWHQRYAELNAFRFRPSPSSKRRRHGDDDATHEEDDDEADAHGGGGMRKKYHQALLRPIVRSELVYRKPAVGYHSYRRPYLRLWFQHIEDLHNVKWFMQHNKLVNGDQTGRLHTIKLYHQQWSFVDQFRLSLQLKYFDWCHIDTSGMTRANLPFNTTCHIHACVATHAIHPIVSSVRPLYVTACFDIECVAKREMDEVIKVQNGAPRSSITFFPDATLPSDMITTISTDLFRLEDEKAVLRVVHQLKSAKVERPDLLVYTFDDERSMLNHWIYLVRRQFDIDTVCGYNNLTFDMPYIVRRCLVLGVMNDVYLSRMYQDHSPIRVKEKVGGSKQRGDMKIEYVDLPGVLQFDGYIACKAREKLDSYKLAECCKKFLKGADSQKDDLDYKYHGPYFMDPDPRKRGILAEYCAQDVQATRKLIIKRGWMDLYFKIAYVTFTDMRELMMSGTTVQTWHYIQNKLHINNWICDEQRRMMLQWLHNGKVLDKLVSYGFEEDELKRKKKAFRCRDPPPKDMFGAAEYKPPKKEQNRQRDQASAFGGLRWNGDAAKGPRQYKMNVAKEARKRLKERAADMDEKYGGGHVQDAVKGFYTSAEPESKRPLQQPIRDGQPTVQPTILTMADREMLLRKKGNCAICTLDFASLYPSIMEARLLCMTTFLPSKPGTHEPDLSTVAPDDIVTFISIFDGKFTTHWVQTSQGRKAECVVPEMENEVVAVRRQVKAVLKTCDPSETSKYKMHELALKIVANGAYGACASVHMLGSIRTVSIATCAFGRMSTKAVIVYIEVVEKLIIVYGDTDSVFIHVPFDRVQYEVVPGDAARTEFNRWKAMFDFTYQLADRVNQNVKVLCKPMKMEFEKNFSCLLLIIKKCYAGLILEEVKDEKTGKNTVAFQHQEDPYMRGFPTVRRDYCLAVRKFLTSTLRSLFTHWNPNLLLDDLRKFVEQFARKQIPLEDLVTTVQLKSAYKQVNKQITLMNKLRARGFHVSCGSRVPYIYIEPPKNVRLAKVTSRDYVEHDDYVKEHKLRPWYEYYLDKQLRVFICKILTPFGKEHEATLIIDQAISRCRGNASMLTFCKPKRL
jgi:DNA polymerase elongation subunit (family B)